MRHMTFVWQFSAEVCVFVRKVILPGSSVFDIMDKRFTVAAKSCIVLLGCVTFPEIPDEVCLHFGAGFQKGYR